jgi:hypothetical protein
MHFRSKKRRKFSSRVKERRGKNKKKQRDGRNVKKASNKKIHKIRDDDGS